MLHPILDTSNFNVVLSVISLFILLYGVISLQIKQRWYLGEALPAFVIGIVLGPVGGKLLDIMDWGGVADDVSKYSEIAFGLTRLVISIQLVKVGYQLPQKYLKQRIVEMTICLFPLMTISWLITSAFIRLMIPHISFLASLIIGACVTCTDPVLSQAIAKGPFADNYVHRPLREFISAEAGGNDGFGFPFLLLAVSLLRYADTPDNAVSLQEFDLANGIPDYLGASDVGRFGGGVGRALEHWAIEGFLYMVVLGTGYGLFVGYVWRKLHNVALKRKWIENESFTLAPLAIGMFIVGTCGCFGSDESLASFVAGNILNWDGVYNSELQARHDTFNSSIESLLNFGTFMYLGAVMPWSQFHMPFDTGITVGRLFGLGFLILLFRRIPAIMLGYRFMPRVCGNWREALFMGYFGPIGIGAISYIEYTQRLFPQPGKSDREINDLTAAMRPVGYFLVLFSIIVHGLSVPALNCLYRLFNVPRVQDHPVSIQLLSTNEPLPTNCTVDEQRHSVMVNNRFSRSPEEDAEKQTRQTRHLGDDESKMEEEDDRAGILRACSTRSLGKPEEKVFVQESGDERADTRDWV